MHRILAARLGLVLALFVGLLVPADVSAVAYPRVMASTGDSMTRAFNTGWLPFTDNPAASWSTGSDSRVVSHFQRLAALTPSGKIVAYNDARSGAKMADLKRQMTLAVSQGAQYVTVLMGANDVCTSSEASMTSVADFTAQFTDAMNTITAGAPRATVYVVSIPNIYHLWEIYKDSTLARFAWDLFNTCQSMLANPVSTLAADVQRRNNVSTRNAELNEALASVCGAYPRQCIFDANTVFNAAFTRSDISTRDYFHPSIAGQAKLAAVSWTASPWGP